MKHVQAAGLTIGNDRPLTVIAGPCQLESADHARMIAETMKAVCDKHGAQFVFKASYDKANRTSLKGKRGLGMDAGLKILSDVGREFGVPTLTDVHMPDQCAPAAEAVDIIQIPAFLCRQTDMLLAAGETGAVINVKKGQFLAPWDMVNVVAKIESTGNEKILLTERGASFGYNTLVAVQQPGGQGGSSGGQREFAPVMARAAVAIGVGAVFIETHEDPDNAPSDGPNMIPLDQMDHLIGTLMALDGIAKSDPILL